MRRKQLRQWLVIGIMIGLLSPTVALAGNGKKQHKEGQRLEAAGQFDRAAEAYLAALAEEANNIQYRIAYQRTASQASVMLVRRGRELMEQSQYEEAYNVFRRAFQFDQTNQIAKDLTARALEMQRKVEGVSSAPVTQTPYGSPAPVTEQIRPQTNPPPANRDPQLPDASSGPSKQVERKTILFRNQTPQDIIKELAGQLGVNVVFDQTTIQRLRQRQDFEMREATVAQAFDSLLMSHRLFFEPLNDNSVLIALDSPQERMRIQQQSLQTFYLKSADPQMVMTTIQSVFQQRVQVFANPERRALVARATPETLKLVGDLIQALDKDRPEVLIDINIYEVSQQDMREIGNQILFSGFLGEGQQARPNGTLEFLGATAGQILSEGRLALGIPSSVLRFLQTRGNSRLIDSLQVHAVDDKAVTANIGQRIPIRTATLPNSFGVLNQPTQPTQPNPNDRPIGSGLGFGVEQIEYQDVGLNVEITPKIMNNEDIQLEMNIQTSGVLSGGNTLTPTFVNRTLKSMATVKSGQAAMMAGVAQKRNEVSRTSLPIIGFLPVVGRLFSIPTQRQNTIDLLITVTPHVIRGTDIREEDKLAMNAGSFQSGMTESIESFLEKREQARRQRQRPQEVAQVREQGTGNRDQGPVRPPAPDPRPLIPETVLSVNATGSTSGGATLTRALVPTDSSTANLGTRNAEMNKDAMPSAIRHPPSAIGRAEPVQVQFALSENTPASGGSLKVTLLGSSGQDVQGANLVVTFNPAVLKPRDVVAGDMFSTSAETVNLSTKTDAAAGTITINITGSGAPGPKSGRVVLIAFDVISSGDSTVQIDRTASKFVAANGALLDCIAKPLAITAK
jgi:general secretion pathway protein D